MRAGRWFQSTPAITGGRNTICCADAGSAALFQSTPAITGGRDRVVRPQTGARSMVSIHARHYCRARPEAAPQPADWPAFQSTPAITGGRDNNIHGLDSRRRCFNPRPPLLAGETRWWWCWRCWPHVSIHARHYWRARPQFGKRQLDCLPLFQSTPAITGGRDRHRFAAPCPQTIVSIHARHYWRARHPGGGLAGSAE